MCFGDAEKLGNNETKKIGLATPTPGFLHHLMVIWLVLHAGIEVKLC